MNRNHLLFFVSLVLFFASCTKEQVKPLGEDQIEITQNLELRSTHPVGFKIDKANAGSGDLVCLDVSVKDFDDILALQYSIAWDSDVLSFSEANNFNLPGLSSSSFGTPSDDRLTLSWFESDLTAISLANNTTIYSLCFNVIGSGGEESSLDFTDNPTSIEVIDGDFNVLATSFKSGRVKVK